MKYTITANVGTTQGEGGVCDAITLSQIKSTYLYFYVAFSFTSLIYFYCFVKN